VETDRRLRPANAWQKALHHPLVSITSAALKFVLLDGLFGKGRCLLCRLSMSLSEGPSIGE
jgi:hypothetical protein